MKNLAIRHRLLVILLSATLAVWSLTAIKNYFDSRYEIAELFDAQLAQSARALLGLSVHQLYEQPAYLAQPAAQDRKIPEGSLTAEIHQYEQRLAFQIWTTDGKLAVRSPNAPTDPLADRSGEFIDRTIKGQRWRVYALFDGGKNIQVHVGERYDQREPLNRDIALRLLTAVTLSLPLLAVLIWFGVGRAMAPLDRITKAVSKRELENLQPINSRGVPQEAKPLVDALNDLFKRLQVALDNILHFTANAAHELRTPLAALKTHAQVAMRAQDDATRNEALRDLVVGVDRATYLVEQLLTLSRLDPESANTGNDVADLYAITETTLAELAPHAMKKDIELSFNALFKGRVAGKEAMLGILVRNLVENAIRYTPPHGTVDISILKEMDTVVLRVSDSGPGIPLEEREKIFKRFYRGINTTAPGSGLGLSIVHRIIEIHNAQAILSESPRQGLQFDVHLRPAADRKENIEPLMQRTG